MKLVWLTIFAILGFLGWNHFFNQPDPQKLRNEAQAYSNRVLKFWMEAMRDDRLEDMRYVTREQRRADCDQALAALHEVERETDSQYAEYTTFTMGGGGAVKVICMADPGGILLNMNVHLEKDDDTGKWWVSRVTVE